MQTRYYSFIYIENGNVESGPQILSAELTINCTPPNQSEFSSTI